MLTLDVSGVLALLDAGDPDHERAKAALLDDPGPYVIPAGILAEVGFAVGRVLGGRALDALLSDLAAGSFTLDSGERDLPRIRKLLRRHADVPLEFADAAVVACAERNGGRVLTLNRGTLDMVARDSAITVLP